MKKSPNVLSKIVHVKKKKKNTSLKLLSVDIKTSASILMRFEMAGMAQNKHKYLIFIVLPQVRVEKQI